MQGWDSLRSSKIRIMQILIDSKDEETKDIDGMNLPQQYFLQKIYYPIELKELDQVLNHEHAHFYHFPTHENTHHLPMQHCEEVMSQDFCDTFHPFLFRGFLEICEVAAYHLC
ncbi:hypothetical protein AABB24_038479 [Solanum stoloniferum]|uniref:Uncharacterized protein n=1 Tax=Solanum stoloniferum TaxID=62892 RepID=A0ABD2QXR7_9SOLN